MPELPPTADRVVEKEDEMPAEDVRPPKRPAKRRRRPTRIEHAAVFPSWDPRAQGGKNGD